MKLRPSYFYITGLLALVVLTSACSRQPAAPEGALAVTQIAAAAAPQATQPPAPQSIADAELDSLARTDEQGQVVLVVTPLNLDNPGQTLAFEVDMNTHSVELGLDLAAMATLSTDTGKSVPAAAWNPPGGGHHVNGTLSFPAELGGSLLLEGAQTLTLTIVDLDAPERVFTWNLP